MWLLFWWETGCMTGVWAVGVIWLITHRRLVGKAIERCQVAHPSPSIVVADCRCLVRGRRPVGDQSFIYRRSVGDQKASGDCLQSLKPVGDQTSSIRPPVVHLWKRASNLFSTKSVDRRFSVQRRQLNCDRLALTTSNNNRRLVGEHANNLWQPPKEHWSQVVVR